MKILGIILIVAGILMFIFPEIEYTQKEKVVDVGRITITRDENKTISWPYYAGGIAVVAGIVLLIADNKKGSAD